MCRFEQPRASRPTTSASHSVNGWAERSEHRAARLDSLRTSDWAFGQGSAGPPRRMHGRCSAANAYGRALARLPKLGAHPHEFGGIIEARQLLRVGHGVNPRDPPILNQQANRGQLPADLETAGWRTI